jgi:predicted ester cyclase
MRDKTKTLLYQWFNEVWNHGQEASIDQLMAPASNARGIRGHEQMDGPDAFKKFYRGFKDQFDDIHIDIKEVVSQDDMESALTEVTATHKETGKKVSFAGLCMVRIENNQIAEAWNQYDFLGLQQQLEQAPTPLGE